MRGRVGNLRPRVEKDEESGKRKSGQRNGVTKVEPRTTWRS